MAAAEADGEASTDVARSPGGDLELLSNQGAAGGGGGGKWKHQSTAAARTWLSRPQLSAAEGTTVGSHQDPIHRFTESRLKCGPRQILAQNQLSKQERQELQRLLQSGLQPVRTVLRALALRQMAEGQTVRQVAKNVGLTPKTVWLTSQRYRQGGLERALYERPRPGKAALLDAPHRQCIVALACGPPPEGRSRWTVRLRTEEVVKRKLVPRVGRETIRVLLESHDLKPWREKNVVRGGTG